MRLLATLHLSQEAERGLLMLSSLPPFYSVWSSRHRVMSSHSEWIFLPQLNISRNNLMEPQTHGGVSPRWLDTLSSWQAWPSQWVGRGGGREEDLWSRFNGTKLWKVKKLWSWMVLITAQQCELVFWFCFRALHPKMDKMMLWFKCER